MRQRDERGTGVLSASFAVLFFLLTILLVTQIAAHLLAESRLAADADHSARVVASATSADALETTIVRQRAWLREHHGEGTDVSINIDANGVVTVDITAASPARTVGAVAAALGIDEVHAVASARSERPR